MRKFAFLLLISLLCLPVLANQEDEPAMLFTYVTTPANEAYQYDMFVMDARSGEVVYSFVREDFDCPYSISEDKNALLYSRGSDNIRRGETMLLNLNTGESEALGSLGASSVTGNHDFSQIVYRYWYNDNQDAYLYIYERSSDTQLMVVEDEGEEVDLIRFADDDLLFVILEEGEIIFNGWNGTSLQTSAFPRYDSDDFSMELSPDGNILKVLYHFNETESILSLIDTTTGITDDRVVPRPGIISSLSWMPNSNSFAYIGRYGGVWFYNTETGEIRRLLAEEEAAWYSNLVWSPDASYLLVQQNLEASYLNLKLIDMSSGIVSNIFTGGNLWNIEWLSGTEFVYDFSEDRFTTDFDIVYYDASKEEMRQLTNTDELDETLYCGWG